MPSTENFASGAIDLKVHKGSKTKDVIPMMTDLRPATSAGTPIGNNTLEVQSPMIIKKLTQAIQVLTRTASAGNHEVPGLTLFDHASW
mmetsp:Transcript_70992/g.197209  ORF Transcript_70992/g.197209 Transcript_70992/m.197209 type:complete len:88 (+) Transcript_70992:898-1161(+)